MYIDKEGKKWFKGNLHTHTKESDGSKTPAEACRLYKDNGYDFLAITDHWKLCEEYIFEDMLVLSGIEYDFGKRAREGIYHIVGFGFDEKPDIQREDGVQKAIDKIHACGGLAILAHPAWSLNLPEMLMKIENIDMTEIFNSASDMPKNCRPYSGVILDAMAAQGVPLALAATDDTHWYANADLCRSYVWVQAEECTKEALKKSFKEGKFYSSQGPVMNVEYSDGKIKVSCSAVEEIVYYSDAVYSPHRSDIGHDLTYGEYTLLKNETCIRIEIKDKDGNYAWSQYIKV